jgi:hypothetical protein
MPPRPAGVFYDRLEGLVFSPSDRPRLYENQSDSPPNPHSLEKIGAQVV